jgi:hypothetical protein
MTLVIPRLLGVVALAALAAVNAGCVDRFAGYTLYVTNDSIADVVLVPGYTLDSSSTQPALLVPADGGTRSVGVATGASGDAVEANVYLYRDDCSSLTTIKVAGGSYAIRIHVDGSVTSERLEVSAEPSLSGYLALSPICSDRGAPAGPS